LHRPELDLDAAGKDPANWRNSGNRLMKGARLAWVPLSQSFRANGREQEELADYFAAFFLLAGLAVENHLKARILENYLAEGSEPADLKQVMDVVRQTHDLQDLAHRAGVGRLSHVQLELLERLTEFVEWSSRYPVPCPGNAIWSNTCAGALSRLISAGSKP
jgi:hypothetical protein